MVNSAGTSNLSIGNSPHYSLKTLYRDYQSMLLDNLFAYTSVIVALTLAPGPLVALTISRSLRKDEAGALTFAMGVAAGDVLVILMIFGGLGLWLQSFPVFFTFAKFTALAYFLYIAYGIWCHTGQENLSEALHKPVALTDVVAGIVTCIVSPRTILAYLMLLPRLVDISDVRNPMIVFIEAFTFVVITLSLSVIVLLACRFNKYDGSSNYRIYLNRTLSLVISLSGFWMVLT